MSPRYSTRTVSEIRYEFWLIFGEDGSMRLSRGAPSLARGERGMACTAALPRSLFRTPELKATIAIAEPDAQAFRIDVEAAGDALRQTIGCDIDLQVRTSEPKS